MVAGYPPDSGIDLSGIDLADTGQRPQFYVVDWLPPDFGAVGQYALLASVDEAAAGRKVCLIGLTSGLASETVNGDLTVRKLPARRYEKSNFIGRLLWSLSTNLRLVRALARDPRSRGADVKFTGAPPFMLFFAVPFKMLRRTRLIYRITDFYPEAIIAHLGRRSFLLGLLERVTWFLRRRIDRFEVLGEDQRALLRLGGIPDDRIVVKRDTSPIAITGREPPAPVPEALAGCLVLLYSGNYGVAHDTDTVIEGLARHHREGSGRFGLWLNATGGNANLVERKLREMSVPVARTPPVALEALPNLLAAADAHLIALRPEFAGIVFPSKVYGSIASGRPIVFVGPASSDVHLLCTGITQGYARVQPGDVAAFTAALENLARKRQP